MLHFLFFLIADLFGIACVAIGAGWLFFSRSPLASFPSSLVEAAACIAGGMAVMAWAMRKMQRGVAAQRQKQE